MKVGTSKEGGVVTYFCWQYSFSQFPAAVDCHRTEG